MVPGSVALMTWNEYRTIHRTQGLIQAEELVAEVPSPFESSAELDQRLVHVTGIATTDALLSDGVFNIEKKVLRLDRWPDTRRNRRITSNLPNHRQPPLGFSRAWLFNRLQDRSP